MTASRTSTRLVKPSRPGVEAGALTVERTLTGNDDPLACWKAWSAIVVGCCFAAWLSP
jgi:hypothetical protein